MDDQKHESSRDKARRIFADSDTGWHRDIVDLMSDEYAVYHWCMPFILVAEAAVLLFLAIWPLWCGVLLFILAVALFDWVNKKVAYLAWRRYDRMYNGGEE